MVDINNDIVFINELKENIVNNLIENEKCLRKGERKYNEDEMNAIIDWTMCKYAQCKESFEKFATTILN